MEIKLTEYPTVVDWFEVKRRALFTAGKKAKVPPTEEWKKKILEARHSPIRRLRFSFDLIDVPYWVSVHLVRHIHAQPYVGSQRNDRQERYDRNEAPQNAPVDMIWDVNGEELLVIANKRLCKQASEETREIVRKCCDLVIEKCPEFKDVLVPMCVYHGGVCHEMFPCGGNKWIRTETLLPKLTELNSTANLKRKGGNNSKSLKAQDKLEIFADKLNMCSFRHKE